MSVQVAKHHGVCLNCHGPLHIIDADDSTMTVCCEECDNDYQVEPDHFGDGGDYWADIMSEIQMQEEDYDVEEDYPSYDEIDELMFGETL